MDPRDVRVQRRLGDLGAWTHEMLGFNVVLVRGPHEMLGLHVVLETQVRGPHATSTRQETPRDSVSGRGINYYSLEMKLPYSGRNLHALLFGLFFFSKSIFTDIWLFLIGLSDRAVARALIGGYIFIYSGAARLVSFEVKLISKEVSRAEPENMNIHTPISVPATALSADQASTIHGNK